MKNTVLLALMILTLLPGALFAQQLTEKVTVNSGGQRLHGVLEDLAGKSGVRIRCGKNTADWQVRDLPLDVYAKDVPLGKLLGWIAQASHLALVSGDNSQNSATDTRTYTIRRDRQGDKELQADEDRSLAEAAWTWDVFAKLGQEPYSASADTTDKKAQSQRLIGKIIASLPPGSKESVLSGEAILLSADYSSQAQMIRQLAKATAGTAMMAPRGVLERNGSPIGYAKNGLSVAVGSSVTDSQTDADARQTMLRIQLFDRGGGKGCSIVFVLSPIVFDQLVISYDLEIRASDADAQRLGLPSRPIAWPTDDDPVYDCGSSKRSFITSENDWEQRILQTKVHLGLPNGDRTYADVLAALAKASGFSIVCEDYVTSRTGPTAELKSLGQDSTIGTVLKQMNACWFCVDEKEHLILGWSKNWRGHQRDLVPEELLTDLAAKVAGTGADLDDVVPLASLTPGQTEEWLRYRCDDRLTTYARFVLNRMLWRVYDALAPEAKLAAKTPAGVSLGGVNMEALREDFRRLRRYDELVITTGTFKPEDKKQTIDEYRAVSSALADPANLHQAILRLKPIAVSGGTVYHLEFDLPTADGVFTMSVNGGPAPFPIRAEAKKP